MAQKKGGGNTSNGRDSRSQRLGVKKFGGQFCRAGNIIIRQRGTKVKAGLNTGLGKDHTIFATTHGKVRFVIKHGRQYVVVDSIDDIQ